MFNDNRYASHESYTTNPRHWHPQSERYSGCDALLTALGQGWHIHNDRILRERRLLGGQRSTTIFHLELEREEMGPARMSIVNTPYLERLILNMGLHVYQAETLTPVEHPAWAPSVRLPKTQDKQQRLSHG